MSFKSNLVSALAALVFLVASMVSPAVADEQQAAVRDSSVAEAFVGKTCTGNWKITDSFGGRLNGRKGDMSFIVDSIQGDEVFGRVLPGTKTALPTPHPFHGDISDNVAETKTDYGGMNLVFHENSTVSGTASVKRDRRFNQARVELELEHMTCALTDD